MSYFQLLKPGRIRFNEHASVIARPNQIVSIAVELSIPRSKLHTPESALRDQAQSLGDDAILAKLRCDIGGMAGQPPTLVPHFVELTRSFIFHVQQFSHAPGMIGEPCLLFGVLPFPAGGSLRG